MVVSAPYPNPVTGGQTLKISLTANPNCPKTVKLGVYTSAYRKVYEKTVVVTGRDVWEWPVVDSTGVPAANGVYYVRVEESGAGTVLKWSPLVVLR